MSDENMTEVGKRSFDEIAEKVYGQPAVPEPKVERTFEDIAAEVVPAIEESATEDLATKDLEKNPEKIIEESQKPRTLEELADTVYPAENTRIAPVLPNGQIATVVRDLGGNIMHGGEGRYSDIRSMIGYYIDALANADLSGLDFAEVDYTNARMAGASLAKSTLHGRLTWSDLKGVNFTGADLKGLNLSYSDLSDAEFDGETDITGATFIGAKYVLSALQQCKGWKTAEGLRMGADK